MWIRYLVGLSISLMISLTASAEAFPTAPLNQLTPGELCQKPDSYRYPEHIAYCERDVAPAMKWGVINLYMKNIPGFAITPQNRSQYKIDHYIPLCMGGANVVSNLWPQHMTIYQYTDIIEEDLCKELELGSITQVQAVAQIQFAKAHVEDLKKLKDATDRMNFLKENYNK
jgi:hypothetical protein